MKTIKKIMAMTILALVFTISTVAPSFAGAIGGGRFDSFRINAFSTNSFRVSFRGLQVAQVYISGDGSTDLDLYIYDQYGNCVGYDNDYSDECLVEWVPTYTSTYTIKVVNRGRDYNEYDISTN